MYNLCSNVWLTVVRLCNSINHLSPTWKKTRNYSI